MKKNQKGFTLIELLVVVAIIGILAAVGVVAYSGYTEGAKKSASKSNHAAVVKFVASELKKCVINGDNTKLMMESETSTHTCGARTTPATLLAAIAEGTSDYKNPHNTSAKAVAISGTSTATGGQVNVVATAALITISTCFSKGSGTEASDVCPGATNANTLINKITIE